MVLSRVLLLLALALWHLGCAAGAQSRFPPDVATALREQSMRRLETDSLRIYYPTSRRDDALRIAERVEGCAALLRAQAKIHNSYADQKMTIVVPDVAFNNAFVAPSAFGSEPVSVIPTSNTLDFASELGVPPDPSYVGCHEIVHYVHVLQASGLWGWVNRVFGDTLTPQVGLDLWFLEGLATYYESRLQPGTGRMAWPGWRGVFHAGYANKRLRGGDLSAFQRPYHWGHHYLAGSHFVEFLAQRYGEDKLWKIIQIQGDSIFFPFGVALRWKAATGKTLPTLIGEFADAVEKHFPPRAKPGDQRKIRSAGSAARYAVAPTGREALLVADADTPARLRVFDNGKLLRERELVEVLPPRTLVTAHPILSSGLSFTGDGKLLYFVSIDSGSNGQEERLLRYDVDQDRLEVVVPRLKGAGGSVSADGKTFYYGYADGDRRHLAALDLTTKAARIIREAEPRNYFDHARPSPDGQRIASSVFDGTRFTIQILHAKSGRTEVVLPFAGAVHDPSWIDDERLLLLAEHKGRFQVHVYELSSGQLARVSDAPYLANQPRAFGDKIRFLDRSGWDWSIDEISLPLRVDAAAEVKVASPTPPVTPPMNKVPRVLSDEPYSQLDSLFFPRIRVPSFLSPVENATLIGMALAGGDPLSFHRWSLFGQYDLVGGHVSGGMQYATALLAPLDLRFEVDHFAWNETIDAGNNMIEEGPYREENRALVAIGRTVRTTRVDLQGVGLQSEDPDNPIVSLRERRLAGPRLNLQHQAFRSTPNAGALAGYSFAASAAHYNQALSSFDVDLSDLSAELDLRTPLPISKWHTLGLHLRGQRLFGLDRDQSFLVVGGSDALGELWSRSDQEEPDELVLPDPEPLREFRQPLRGFENLSFATDRIAIADLTYRLPIPIDFGFASTAFLLPSLHFRQLDFELFGTAATDSFASFEEHHHLAAGGSAALAMSLFVVPFRVQYQLARRFTDDEALVHLFTLSSP
jgi:hypothetical protein